MTEILGGCKSLYCHGIAARPRDIIDAIVMLASSQAISHTPSPIRPPNRSFIRGVAVYQTSCPPPSLWFSS